LPPPRALRIDGDGFLGAGAGALDAFFAIAP
jgi:hypothetical protein